MKKSFKIIVVGLSVLMFFAGSAMATEIATTAITGGSVGTASGGRPVLDEINQSPNVVLGAQIAPDEFAISAVNSKGVIEYGVSSDSSDIYFKSVDSGQTATSMGSGTTAESAFPTASWATLGTS